LFTGGTPVPHDDLEIGTFYRKKDRPWRKPFDPLQQFAHAEVEGGNGFLVPLLGFSELLLCLGDIVSLQGDQISQRLFFLPHLGEEDSAPNNYYQKSSPRSDGDSSERANCPQLGSPGSRF